MSFEKNLDKYLECYHCPYGERVSKIKIVCPRIYCKGSEGYEVKRETMRRTILK